MQKLTLSLVSGILCLLPLPRQTILRQSTPVSNSIMSDTSKQDSYRVISLRLSFGNGAGPGEDSPHQQKLNI